MARKGNTAFIPKIAAICKECGCTCNSCFNSNSLDLHHEIEDLKSKLCRSNDHMEQMEQDVAQSRDYAHMEICRLQDDLGKLRDRYDRLFESHRKLQKLNHNLEDKLLNIVAKFNNDKQTLQQDIGTLNAQVVDAKFTICDLEEECERFRTDCNVAVKLLQCTPPAYVSHKLNTLPLDLQERVKAHLTPDEVICMEEASTPPPETKMIRVPMPTFPPTAMLYSVPRSIVPPEPKQTKVDTVPTTLIAQVLSKPETKQRPRRFYICNECKRGFMCMDRDTQTGNTNCDSYSMKSRLSNINGHSVNNTGMHQSRQNSVETQI
ncbi:hypothetical protein NP493_359g10020 [Ridgeia piscesae]|uniref:Uncharacterized protein n=1 Tax=Ridgeia piscesae TaxID=27915 RepID=A0AAD9L450_RIDPI|nr:hypothetical protein NP493_359g10020 [Ridgeia piscesae]